MRMKETSTPMVQVHIYTDYVESRVDSRLEQAAQVLQQARWRRLK